uniref:Eukaryotic translation initiation factor 2A n=1 Tax=Steinernema glaseri TaxID=37863 RepID=A0A1I7Y480_9BILA
MGENLLLAIRGSTGLFVRRGVTNPPNFVLLEEEESKTKTVRTFAFSNSGQYFAYCDCNKTVVLEVASGRTVISEALPRTTNFAFSPRDRICVTYEPYVIYGARTNDDNTPRQPLPNLRFWSLVDGRLLTTLVANKNASWRPQWTEDESTAVRLSGSELHVYKNNNFERFESKLVLKNVQSFEISHGHGNHHLCCYIPGSGGQPAVVQLRKFDEKATLVGNKTFFKCDSVKMKWNLKGTACIVMSLTDVDAANKSYYGESTLYLMTTSGDSCLVNLDKQGPVYAVEWNPNGKEFTVCYGFMPARVCTFNLKGDVIWDNGTQHVNELHYNRFGNILLVCGFGNISSGRMDFYNVDEKKLIVSIKVPNCTQFAWAPDGQHFVTAQTAPRLRFENGYRIWHYTGKLISEVLYAEKEELAQILWRPLPSDALTKFKITELTAEQKAQAGLPVKNSAVNGSPAVAAGAVTKKTGYIPPHLRKANGAGALKPPGAAAVVKPAVSENEKKARNIQKKLDEIEKLKAKLEAGEVLQKNQLAKMDKRDEYIAELEALKISS